MTRNLLRAGWHELRGAQRHRGIRFFHGAMPSLMMLIGGLRDGWQWAWTPLVAYPVTLYVLYVISAAIDVSAAIETDDIGITVSFRHRDAPPQVCAHHHEEIWSP